MSTSNQHSEDDSPVNYPGDTTVAEAPSNNSAPTIASATPAAIPAIAKTSTPLDTQKGATWEWREPFLAALGQCGTVTVAAERVGMNRTAAYLRRRDHPDFAEAWDEAVQEHADRLEQTLFDDIASGNFTPVDRIFALKGAKPAKYKDNYNEAARAGAGTVHVTFVIASPKPEPYTIEAEARELPPAD